MVGGSEAAKDSTPLAYAPATGLLHAKLRIAERWRYTVLAILEYCPPKAMLPS